MRASPFPEEEIHETPSCALRFWTILDTLSHLLVPKCWRAPICARYDRLLGVEPDEMRRSMRGE